MVNKIKTCFVCKNEIPFKNKINLLVNLPVCEECTGNIREKLKEEELFDSLANGLVCGCL